MAGGIFGGVTTARDYLRTRLSKDIGANNPTAEFGAAEQTPGGDARQQLGSIMGDGPAAAYNGKTGNAIIDAGMQAIGKPYVWGGNSLGRGVDCSGLVQQAFLAAGIHVPRTAAAQAKAARPVDAKDARPGDLVIWDTAGGRDRVRGGADHIGIYLGNGRVLEASSSNKRVVVRQLWGPYRFGRIGGGG